MLREFHIDVVEPDWLDGAGREEILRLCNEAYGEDVSHLFAAYSADLHVLAWAGEALVGHGMIVTRWLQAGVGPLLRTAYVELVATAEGYRNRGIGASIMRRLAEEAVRGEYDLAALCPADTGLYGHLGWEYWQGPLFIRPVETSASEPAALIATPEERVMILRLPRTPMLDPTQSLSAEWRAGGELW